MTQEQFIEKASECHNNKYDYSKTIYTSARDSVTIICPIHGEFSICASKHANGGICQECAKINRSNFHRGSRDDFVSRANKIHNYKYDYSLVEYETARKKVKIICKKHDTVFEQAPYVHLTGKGCIKCAHDKLAEERSAGIEHFIFRARQTHGDKYTYAFVEYKNAHTKVTVTCKEHGNFTVSPSNHWEGNGCPLCAEPSGFKTGKPASLYVIGCGDITKVGITNKPVEDRARDIGKSYGYEFSILQKYHFDDGRVCSEIETLILRYLKSLYKNPSSKFDGYTECFFNVDKENLYRKIESLRNEYEC